MDRRSFLKKAGLGTGAAAASTLAAPAMSQNRMELRMVTSWPKNFPGLGTGAERFAQLVTDATEGRITVKVFAGGEIVPPLKVHDAVQEGAAEMYHSADYYFQGKAKAYNFFTAVPLGLLAHEMNAWLKFGGAQALWDEVGDQFGIKHLAVGNSGTQMAGWFNKRMQTVEDFRGLRMRIPGIGGDVVTALGGTTVTLAGAEILPAFQSGALDAVEFVGPWNDLALGFYKVVKYYHYPCFHEAGPALSLGISRSVWDGLSESDQTLISAIADSANSSTLAEFNANNTQALDTLINEHGVELVEYPDDLFKAIGEACNDVLDSVGSGDPLTQKVYSSFIDFRKKAVKWTSLADQAYANKRSLMNIA